MVTKKPVKAAKKTIKTLRKTAKKMNKRAKKNGFASSVIDTVTDVVSDAIEPKPVKAVRKSVKKIRKTAKKVNKKVIRPNLKLAEAAIDSVNDKLESINLGNNFDQVRATAKDATKFTLETTDEMVDESYDNGKRALALTEKAMKGGLKLAKRQQEITFDALEEAKDQLTDSAKRFRKLLAK